MQVFELKNGLVKIIKVDEEFFGLPERAFQDALKNSGKYSEILIDFSDVVYVGESFLRYLLKLAKSLIFNHTKVKLLNPGDLVQIEFARFQLDRFYDIQNVYPTAW